MLNIDTDILMVKYAITMLCMLKDHYVLGCCISSFAHRQLIRKSVYIDDIDLIIMCDQYIYDKYASLLSRYFDHVKLIKLHHLERAADYRLSEIAAKKYSWFGYSINKWQCLKYDEYDKILFIDIDILPMKKEFYNIFANDTPCFQHINQINMYRKDIGESRCVNNSKSIDILKKYNSFYDYIYKNMDYIYSKKRGMGGYTINGGIVLLKPDKKVYDRYKEFVYKTFGKGMYSFRTSGPDETTLFYFYQKIYGRKSYRVCDEYLVVTWDSPELVKKALAFNYIQFIKPWLKPTFLSWPEEILWRNIYEIMPKKGGIKKLFKKVIVYGYNLYLESDNKEKYFVPTAANIADINEPTYNKIIKLEKKLAV